MASPLHRALRAAVQSDDLDAVAELLADISGAAIDPMLLAQAPSVGVARALLAAGVPRTLRAASQYAGGSAHTEALLWAFSPLQAARELWKNQRLDSPELARLGELTDRASLSKAAREARIEDVDVLCRVLPAALRAVAAQEGLEALYRPNSGRDVTLDMLEHLSALGAEFSARHLQGPSSDAALRFVAEQLPPGAPVPEAALVHLARVGAMECLEVVLRTPVRVTQAVLLAAVDPYAHGLPLSLLLPRVADQDVDLDAVLRARVENAAHNFFPRGNDSIQLLLAEGASVTPELLALARGPDVRVLAEGAGADAVLEAFAQTRMPDTALELATLMSAEDVQRRAPLLISLVAVVPFDASLQDLVAAVAAARDLTLEEFVEHADKGINFLPHKNALAGDAQAALLAACSSGCLESVRAGAHLLRTGAAEMDAAAFAALCAQLDKDYVEDAAQRREALHMARQLAKHRFDRNFTNQSQQRRPLPALLEAAWMVRRGVETLGPGLRPPPFVGGLCLEDAAEVDAATLVEAGKFGNTQLLQCGARVVEAGAVSRDDLAHTLALSNGDVARLVSFAEDEDGPLSPVMAAVLGRPSPREFDDRDISAFEALGFAAGRLTSHRVPMIVAPRAFVRGFACDLHGMKPAAQQPYCDDALEVRWERRRGAEIIAFHGPLKRYVRQFGIGGLDAFCGDVLRSYFLSGVVGELAVFTGLPGRAMREVGEMLC